MKTENKPGKTLLEQAIALNYGRDHKPISAQEIELAIAWAGGLVTHSHISRVTGKPSSNVYSFLAMALREAFSKGSLVKGPNL